MSRNLIAKISLFVVLLGVALVGVVFLIRGSNAVVQPGVVYLHNGADFQTLTDSLEAGGYIKNMSHFRTEAKLEKLDQKVKGGCYQIPARMSYKAVVRMFRLGLQKPVRFTFNNIRLMQDFAGTVSSKLDIDSTAMVRELLSPEVAEHYGFEQQTFLAMFIPNTYELYWNVSPTAFLDRMKKEYDKFWTDDREQKLQTVGLTRIQASILASIVYEETKFRDEMPTVAGVYLNRIRLGMPLQADPTVKFAVGDFALRRILNKHLTTDSPYNTYLYKGLPPGPICMPSIAAIDAVLNPAKHKYLYFCANPDFSGTHVFAETLTQHAANARRYHEALR